MFREMTERHEVIRRFLEVLNIGFDDLSYLLGGRQRDETKTRYDMRARVRHFREHPARESLNNSPSAEFR